MYIVHIVHGYGNQNVLDMGNGETESHISHLAFE